MPTQLPIVVVSSVSSFRTEGGSPKDSHVNDVPTSSID